MRNPLSIIIALLLVSALLSNTAVAYVEQPSPFDEGTIQVPEDLGECFESLKKWMTPEDLEVYKNTEEDGLARYHRGLGLSMRNGWGLWGGSPLKDFFHKIGIYHPDDMSGIILRAFNRHLNGKKINLKELTKHYVDYWQERGSDTAVSAPDMVLEMAEKTAYERQGPVTLSEDALVAGLNSTDPAVRMRTLGLAGKFGDKPDTKRVAEMLNDDNVGVRLEAIYALERIDEASSSALIVPLIKDADPLTRKNAASVLNRSKNKAPIIAAYNTEDRDVRLRILNLLSGSDDHESIALLARATKDEDPDISAAATERMDAIARRFSVDRDLFMKARVSTDEKKEISADAAQQMDIMVLRSLQGTGWIPRLKDESPYVRMYFAECLGRHKKSKATDAIIELLEDDNDDVARSAISALAMMDDARAVEPLERFMKKPGKERFSEEAAEAVATIREDRTYRKYLEIMTSGSDDQRREAVSDMADYDDPRAVDLLIGALKDENYWVREYAIGVLGYKGDKRAVEPLMDIVYTHGDSSRMPDALGKFGDIRVIPYLIMYLDDGNGNNMQDAARSLYQLGWQPETTDDKVRYYFGLKNYEKLSEVGEPAVDYLVAKLKDKYMRQDAIVALGKSGSPRAVVLLRAFYLPDVYYGRYAADSLEELGWKPDNDTEEVWYWIGKRDKKSLKDNWSKVRELLLIQAAGTDKTRARLAVYTLLGSNDPESAGMLLDVFRKNGSEQLAAIFIQTGDPDLSAAANEWADANGITIVEKPNQNFYFFRNYIQLF